MMQLVRFLSQTKLRLTRFNIAVLALIFTWSAPLVAMAQDEDEVKVDARLQSYPTNVALEPSSSALTWILLILLAALCVGVMFKNANRSHLD